jgi:hypothetical protein
MLTKEDKEKLREYDGPVDIDSIVKFIYNQTVDEIRKNEMSLIWPYPFTLKEYEDFSNNKNMLLYEVERKLNFKLEDAKNDFLADWGINCNRYSDQYLSNSEKHQLLNKMMYSKIKNSDEMDFYEIADFIEEFMSKKMYSPIIRYISREVLPNIHEYRHKKMKMDD